MAYLKSLGRLEAHPHAHPEAAVREQVVGPLRVRLEYAAAPSAGHHHGGHGAGPARHPASHLMVFVSDVESGEPVPYLPVTATIDAAGRPRRTVRLVPMVGGEGFHYGADLTLSATTTIVVSIGPTTARVMPTAADRFSTPRQVRFDWSPGTAAGGAGMRHGVEERPLEPKGH